MSANSPTPCADDNSRFLPSTDESLTASDRAKLKQWEDAQRPSDTATEKEEKTSR